jgi:predicted outer membrane repeat protein
LRLEPLEDRITPADLTVTNLSGNVATVGSLPYEVSIATTGQSIGFQAGLTGTIPLGAEITLGAGGNGVTNVTIDGAGASISVSGQNSTRLFEIVAGSDTIKNLALNNGQAVGGYGGAVLVDNGAALNLNTDTFSGNGASSVGGDGGNGGAIENNGTLTDNGSNFVSNVAEGAGGAIDNTGSLTETGTTFTNNSTGGNGGAIESNGGGQGQLTVSNSFFYSNNATGSGGAIDTSDPTTLTSDIFGGLPAGQLNTAQNGNGGAVNNALSATLAGDQFYGNQAKINGGAIANGSHAFLTVNSTLFQTNTAGGAGGAIENDYIANIGNISAFQDNSAGTNGGAIDSNSGNPAGYLGVANSTFYGNQAMNGGAISTTDNTSLNSDTFGSLAPADSNRARFGGAVDAVQGAAIPAFLTVIGCAFTNNIARAANGGAIETTDTTDVESSIFVSNQAPFGGAIAYVIGNEQELFTSSLTVNQDSFQQNGPSPSSMMDGGAIFSSVNLDAGLVAVKITNSTFTQNGGTAPDLVSNGGAVDIVHTTAESGSASATFSNDTFFNNNSGDHGGGIALFLNNTGTGTNTAALTSLTVNQNTAVTDSGGVYVGTAQPGTVSMDNNILDGNTVTTVGYNGPVDVTLVANNVLNDVGYNLVGTSDTMFVNGVKNDILNDTTGLANTLEANGAKQGYQNTLALQTTPPASPAYDTGDPNLMGTMDERGYIRQPGKVSRGAEDPDAQ